MYISHIHRDGLHKIFIPTRTYNVVDIKMIIQDLRNYDLILKRSEYFMTNFQLLETEWIKNMHWVGIGEFSNLTNEEFVKYGYRTIRCDGNNQY